jgi:hypothetical protein
MSTINAIFEPDQDGDLRLPLPPELRHVPVKVTATLEATEKPAGRPQFGCLAGKIELSPGFDDPLEEFQDYME